MKVTELKAELEARGEGWLPFITQTFTQPPPSHPHSVPEDTQNPVY